MKPVFQIAFGIVLAYIAIMFLNVFLVKLAMWLVALGPVR